ncbi:DNA-binding transcriptional regulator, LacI/PurR family [Agromyces sp. CF514]|uniref:LacI family DNA-binding transcriptional regulator n=1 Tax=Agromyces sp. CF514 TaxID=1881031 RepID=UPI0008E12D03|nr:LacI family DNA-binding transcriptional regulator [Agromyces sp. CF514]SFR74816.1 DNA-binding transcriptional regulator, LacI/PurR family [Agromyces sp. CF514]
MRSKRVTMKDVSVAAGVSQATVSFVLNDKPTETISPETRERVRRAAAELGYVPNGSARALREGTSRIVILNVARLPHGGTGLAAFIDALDAELERLDHMLLVRYRAGSQDIDRLTAMVSPRAVLDLDRIYDSPDAEQADGGWIEGLAAHTAVQIRHLVGTGHSDLGLAVPGARGEAGLARLADLRIDYARRVLEDLRMPQPHLLAMGPTVDDDRRSLAEFVELHPQVTAVAALDDETALRVLAAASTLGIDVPGRLAVIGFDDAGLGEFSSPALTSVRIDTAAFGRRLARTVLGLPADPAAPAPAAAAVVHRAST